MTSTRLWDRAAALPAPADGRRRPGVVALTGDLPTVTELFDFMRDAELRFATLRMRIEERVHTTRGEETAIVEVALRHPGEAKVTTTREHATSGKAEYEIWISDGDLVRTYAAAHRLGTQRPIRNRPRGLADRDFPGSSKVYEPLTALPMETLPDTFVHPAGFCQNVLATGRCSDLRHGARRRARSRPPRLRSPADDRSPRPTGRTSTSRSPSTARRASSCASSSRSAARSRAMRRSSTSQPDAPLPPSAFEFVFPTGTTMLY